MNQPDSLEIYLECELRTEIEHPRTHEMYTVTGRADWAGGYNGRAGSETILFCAEAKQGKTFGEVQSQLLTYLAICRHARQVCGKPVPCVQGLSTDGCLYRFQHLSPDGTLYISKVFDITLSFANEICTNEKPSSHGNVWNTCGWNSDKCGKAVGIAWY